MMNRNVTFAILGVLVGSFVAIMTEWRSCSVIPQRIKIDTLHSVQIMERPVFITDTIKVKSVSWKTKDSVIFISEEIPCNDTAFVAQADSVIVPTGDTLNLAFNYQDRRGSFSLVFKPRPDTIMTREILKPIETEAPFPFAAIFGALGLGTILGLYLSK